MRTAAIIVAGGRGERFGRPEGKQLTAAAGRPVLAWSIAPFDRAPSVDLIVVVCPAEKTAEFEAEAVVPFGFLTLVEFAASGETRQDSVMSGLQAVGDRAEIVAVHDGARPLIDEELIEHCVGTLQARTELAGVVVGHPSVDTLKLADNDLVVETPDRSRFWAVQTPQVFRRHPLLAAHQRARHDGFVGTDDSSLVERDGLLVALIEGPRDNIKVTLPEDLAFVEAALRHRER